MGRRPTVNMHLPKGMRARRRGEVIYYALDMGGKPRIEVQLGTDYTEAIKKWLELKQDEQHADSVVSFRQVAERYMREELPKKAERTQKDNIKELRYLCGFFTAPRLADIRPIHVRQYLDMRGKSSEVRANREKALLSHIWNCARKWGITDLDNPCRGIRGFSEKGRDIYIEDGVYKAVWNAADETLRDALDLAYLTGQRPADTLKMSAADIKDGAIHIQQGKTGKKLRIAITGELEKLLARIHDRKKTYSVHSLALICATSGQALTPHGLRARFDKAREQAAKNNPYMAAQIAAFQFRDLRAKAGTDKAETAGIHSAQKQLGHSKIGMTEHYIRARKGDKTSPTK